MCGWRRCRCESGLHAGAIEMPLGHEAVGGQPAMQAAAGNAVKVRQIRAADGAEQLEVDASIANLERIECPLDQFYAARQRFFPLRQLQLPTDSVVLVFRPHPHHVGVKVHLSTAVSRKSVEESENLASVVNGAKYLPANLAANQ